MPIHYWIRYRKDEPIPDELKFKGWKKYVDVEIYHDGSDSDYGAGSFSESSFTTDWYKI